MIIKASFESKGLYYYLLPTYTQAKRIIWDGITIDGMKFLDYIPQDLIENTNSTEMKITLKNNSIIQLIGTDHYDSIRGTNPRGCVFSEYAFHNPMAWEVVKPILKVNKGWAVFNTTPNGKNHAYDMYEMAKDNPDWFCERLTVEDTDVVSKEDIQKERVEGMSEEMIQQEYYCSFDIGAMGAYYRDEMMKANEEERITKLPFFNDKEVDMAFDLGINDMFSIWFFQKVGQQVNFINYYENNNKKLDYYFAYIREYLESKNGKMGTFYIPHDSKKRDLITGKTIEEEFGREFGHHTVEVVERGDLRLGIQAVRKVLPRCLFDPENCRQGIRCLENYHREYDVEKKVFKNKPLHDWSSHGADSFRMFAVAYKEPVLAYKTTRWSEKEPFDRFSAV